MTGILADKYGLTTAMKLVPFIAVAAIVALLLGRVAYPSSLRRPGVVAAADSRGGRE